MKRAKAALSSVEERLSKIRQLPLGNRASSFVIDQLVEETSKDIASRNSQGVLQCVAREQPTSDETKRGEKKGEATADHTERSPQDVEREPSSSTLSVSTAKRGFAPLSRQGSHPRSQRGKRLYGRSFSQRQHGEKNKKDEKTEEVDLEDAAEVEQTAAVIAASHYAAALLGGRLGGGGGGSGGTEGRLRSLHT